MKIITFYNNKGGVGKTTSVINAAYFLHKAGKKVLVVDCDRQSNSYRFFKGADELCSRYANIDVITYSGQDGGVFSLSDCNGYDYVILDLPPALNDFTGKILSICDYVFVPIELGIFSIQGIPTVINAINQTSAKFGGCFVVKYHNANPSDAALLELLEEQLGAKVLKTIIPFSRVVKNSISYGMTAAEYMHWMEAPERYAKLTEEIVRICG